MSILKPTLCNSALMNSTMRAMIVHNIVFVFLLIEPEPNNILSFAVVFRDHRFR